jgi:hypothetical protein
VAGEIGAEFQNMTKRAPPSAEVVPAGLEVVESHSGNAASAAPSLSGRRFAMEPLARVACHWMSAMKSRMAERRAAQLRRLRSRR